MRLLFGKILFICIAVFVVSLAVYQIFTIKNSVRKALAEETARFKDKNPVPFEKRILTPHLSQNISILQNTNEARDFVKFQNHFYATTGGGLVELDDNGKLVRHFTILDGLPESDLTSITVYQNKLYIGTRTKSLVAFDGEKFENYIFTDRETQTVGAFTETDGKLLIGTMKGGLLEFDGARFSEIEAEGKRISGITCLQKDGARLFVGTFDNGLWIFEPHVWTHFTTAENLPSNRIVGIAAQDKNFYVATDFGLAVKEGNTFRPLAVAPALSDLILFDNRIFIIKDNGEIFTFEKSLKEFSARKDLQKSRFVVSGERLFLLSSEGISEITGAKTKPFFVSQNETLTDNFVSSIAFDSRKNLWVGTFRRGIDVFSREGKKVKHLESESVREINYLCAAADKVSAATAGGLQTFRGDFSAENATKNEGLPSNSITHFSGAGIATAKGLAFRENGKFRLLSTVHNLPNNSVYATLEAGEKFYAGTLGGLAEIENRRVVRTFKDSNSDLTTNWVTALIRANGRIFIGTYGGGIFELLPSGEIRSFAAETGKFVVNPNALFSDGVRLYAGTLTGVKILDLQTQNWTTVKRVLPSETVMIVAGDNDYIYFGTTSGIARIGKDYFANGENE